MQWGTWGACRPLSLTWYDYQWSWDLSPCPRRPYLTNKCLLSLPKSSRKLAAGCGLNPGAAERCLRNLGQVAGPPSSCSRGSHRRGRGRTVPRAVAGLSGRLNWRDPRSVGAAAWMRVGRPVR